MSKHEQDDQQNFWNRIKESKFFQSIQEKSKQIIDKIHTKSKPIIKKIKEKASEIAQWLKDQAIQIKDRIQAYIKQHQSEDGDKVNQQESSAKEGRQTSIARQERHRVKEAWQKWTGNEDITERKEESDSSPAFTSFQQTDSDSSKDSLPSRSRVAQQDDISSQPLSRSSLRLAPMQESIDDLPQRTDQTKDKLATSPASSFLFAFDSIYIGIKHVLLVLTIFILFLVALGGGAGYGYFSSLLNDEYTKDKKELVATVSQVSSSSSMYYRDGSLIDYLRTDLKRTPIQLGKISPHLIEAVIATEDNSFFEHDGIVPKAIIRAVIEQVTGSGSTGGSTITQQLVKQQLLSDETTFERKANEMVLAMELEKNISKHEILEAYLNVSPFGRNHKGENIAGVEEAARGIFGVAPEDLNLPQAAFLAGLPKSPIEYSPYEQNGQLKADQSDGLKRYSDVLFFMYREGYITEDEYQKTSDYDITQDFLAPGSPSENKSSYVYDEVERRGRELLIEKLVEEDKLSLEEVKADENLYNDFYERADDMLRNGGYKIHTTIDPDIQQRLQEVIQENAWFIGSKRDVYWENEETGETEHMVEEAQNGSVLIDNETGQILAFVGGLDYEKNNFNNATQMRRSPASAIKPFSVYGPALELGVVTPASVVYDGPITINIPGVAEAYEPKNDTGFSNRWWNVREALAASQNIPAVRIFSEIYTQHDLKPYFRNAGIGPDAIPDEDFNYLSLALGGTTIGTTVEELTGAYAAIANNGVYKETHIIEKIEDGKGDVVYDASKDGETHTVFSEETAFLLQDILRDTSSIGTAKAARSALNFDLDFMSKTGTSDDTKDIWYIGSTPKVTLGSWIGYRNVMATNQLYPEFGYIPSNRNQIIWARMMNALHELKPGLLGTDQTFDQPSTIVQDSVLANTGMKAGQVTGPNGQIYTASGPYKTEFFHPDHVPGITTYDFAINGTAKELQAFWSGEGNPNASINPNANAQANQGQAGQQATETEPQEEQEGSGNIINDFIEDILDQFTP